MCCCHSPSAYLSQYCFQPEEEKESSDHLDILTTKENKPIDAHFFISRDTDVVNQSLFVTHSAQCCHEPAISIAALADIRGCRSIHIELGFLKYLLRRMPISL